MNKKTGDIPVCGESRPDYELMYMKLLDQLDEQRNENAALRSNIDHMGCLLDQRDSEIAMYKAALNAIEVITGRPFDFLHEGEFA